MLKAVIFDLDDTLCNSDEVFALAIERTFTKYLVHFPGKTVEDMLALERESIGELFKERYYPVPVILTLVWIRLFEKLNLKPDLKVILQMRRHTWEEMYKHIKLLPGAWEVLEYLKENKIKVGILTNGPFLEQAEKVIALGIDNHVDYLVGSDLTMADKPDKAAFEYILKKMVLTPSEAIMVGDYIEYDIMGAKGVGMQSVLLRHTNRPYTSEEEKVADLVIDSLIDLKTYLSKQVAVTE